MEVVGIPEASWKTTKERLETTTGPEAGMEVVGIPKVSWKTRNIGDHDRA